MPNNRVKLSLSIDVAAPIETAFHYLTDWPRQKEWMLGTYVEIRSEADARSLGGEIAAFTGIGPLGFWDTMTITKWQAPTYVEVEHTGVLVRGMGYMRFEEVSESACRFEWGEELDLPLGVIGRIGFAVLKPLFVFGVKKSLKDFANRAAQEPR
jgi:hypothetical protein